MRAAILTAALALAACGGESAPAADATQDAPAYAAPPVATHVELQDGQVVVAGRAGPGERVRLIEMDGTAHGVTADDRGLFAISLPGASPQDRLFNLSVERAGQSVSSDGWLFSPGSAPQRALMLRAGGASLPVGPAPLLAVVDVDGGGGVAVSGVASADQSVTVSLDGRPAAEARADSQGRWFAVLSAATTPGPHRIAAVAGDQREDRMIDLTLVRSDGAISAAPNDTGIRIAWALPGGGAQTTLLLLTEP